MDENKYVKCPFCRTDVEIDDSRIMTFHIIIGTGGEDGIYEYTCEGSGLTEKEALDFYYNPEG